MDQNWILIKISICPESVYINTEMQFFSSKVILFGYNIISPMSGRGETAALWLLIENQVKNRQRSYLIRKLFECPFLSYLILPISFFCQLLFPLFSPSLLPSFVTWLLALKFKISRTRERWSNFRCSLSIHFHEISLEEFRRREVQRM